MNFNKSKISFENNFNDLLPYKQINFLDETPTSLTYAVVCMICMRIYGHNR